LAGAWGNDRQGKLAQIGGVRTSGVPMIRSRLLLLDRLPAESGLAGCQFECSLGMGNASNKMAGGARWKWWLLLALALAIAATNCTG